MGRKAGLQENQLRELTNFEVSSAFSHAEKLALRLAVAMTRTPAVVDDALFVALDQEFSQRQLVELATAIAWENHRARFNRVFDIKAENFSEGAFCPMPEPDNGQAG